MNESGKEVLAFALHFLVAACIQEACSKGIESIADFLWIGVDELLFSNLKECKQGQMFLSCNAKERYSVKNMINNIVRCERYSCFNLIRV